ncbi:MULTISPECIES: hypothetical protein [unclassified Fusibacter]|uniref:hypothetical protein n=1 Tax=unclassified Fusibacter TaxID=2624464 RepID=UPI001010BD19|nr:MULTISPECIES: hypothetical protein [unclassified Fusibacter]MCK8058473.1 hypothetical protein [Fusibacter sp. A2]NPE22759.1 hypothetical protein [Fusibacter sp. A1]RXV60317.1 hypothetical protein DWB64_13005 [Fusibacter sp. A1]
MIDYTVTYQDKSVTVREMTFEDILEVAGLYSEIEINISNYKEKLFEENENSFNRRGGMFFPQNEKTLHTLLKKGEKFLLGIEQDRVTAMIWFASNIRSDGYYDKLTYISDDLQAIVQKEVKRGTIVDGGEIIVSKRCTFPHLAEILLYTFMTYISSKGFTSTNGEVYRVVGYSDSCGQGDLDVFNSRSMALLEKTGAKRLATVPRKTVVMENVTVEVEPIAVLWDVKESLGLIKTRLQKSGLVLEEGEDLIETGN